MGEKESSSFLFVDQLLITYLGVGATQSLSQSSHTARFNQLQPLITYPLIIHTT